MGKGIRSASVPIREKSKFSIRGRDKQRIRSLSGWRANMAAASNSSSRRVTFWNRKRRALAGRNAFPQRRCAGFSKKQPPGNSPTLKLYAAPANACLRHVQGSSQGVLRGEALTVQNKLASPFAVRFDRLEWHRLAAGQSCTYDTNRPDADASLCLGTPHARSTGRSQSRRDNPALTPRTCRPDPTALRVRLTTVGHCG